MVPFLKGKIKLDFPLCFRGVTFKTLQKQKITVGYRAWDLIVVVLSFDSNNSQWRFSRSSENIMHQIGKKTIYSIHYPDLLFVREQQKENSVCVWGKKKRFCGSTCNIFSFEADEDKEKNNSGLYLMPHLAKSR